MSVLVEPVLRPWESFYVIVGSAGGALTGLQFVVIAVVANMRTPSAGSEIDTFATPTIVHFCSALLVSAMMNVPWPTLRSLGSALAICGVFGVLYTIIVMRRATRTTGYQPVLEDWIWHTTLPFVGYGALLGGGLGLVRGSTDALFAIAAAALLLLFVGVHNAWDAATYLTVAGINAAARTASAPVQAASAAPVAMQRPAVQPAAAQSTVQRIAGKQTSGKQAAAKPGKSRRR